MRVLIISEHYAPAQGMGSVRWTKLAKYLAQEDGVRVDVLTNRKCFNSRIPLFSYEPSFQYCSKRSDDLASDMKFCESVILAKRGIPTLILNAIRNCQMRSRGTSLSTTSNLRFADQKKNNLANLRVWVKRAISKWRNEAAARDAYNTIRDQQGSYDIVITSYGPIWPHIVGQKLKQAAPSIKWVADFRDFPLVEGHRSLVDEGMIKRFAFSADVITTVGPCELQTVGLPVRVVPNGFDDPCWESRAERAKTDKFMVVYTGSLYENENGRSDLTPILDVLSNMIDDGTASEQDIEIVYAGGTEQLFLDQAEEYSSIPCRCCGNLPRENALELQRHASIVLLAYWCVAGYEGATGKIYEYATSGTPVIGLCSSEGRKGIPSYLIQEGKCGVTYCISRDGLEAKQQLRDYVEVKYREWLKFGFTTLSVNKEIISQFDYKNISNHLYGICEELLERND